MTHLPSFRLLSESQLRALHHGALEVLRRTGVRFHHAGALEMLREAGASISDGNRVRFPASLVEDAIASVPGRIVLCDRDGEPAMALEGTRTYFGTGSDCLHLLDPHTGEHRAFTQADLVDAYRLVDALPNLHFLMSVGLPGDVPATRAYDVQMALMLEHARKPIVFVTDDRASCQRALDMAAAVAGGYEALRVNPQVLLYAEPSSPLQQSETSMDKLLLMAELGLPLLYSPGPQMGATAPITPAGGLAMSLAEILSGLVVHQLRRRGAPFVFGAGLHHMDMKVAQICYAGPEFQLTKAAVAELGRWYGMPTWGYAGCSDAKVLDTQAALETMLSVTMAQLTGANLIHDVGYLESGLTASFELMVLTDELVAMTAPLRRGLAVDDETLLLDEIHRAGPGGHYLDAASTLARFRDFWYPGLLDRRTRPRWLEAGGTTLEQRLNARVREILAEHRPAPLAEEKRRAIHGILAGAA